MPTDDPPVSTVEDLDLGSAPRKSDVEVRELLLGLLLLLAITGWAVWQARQQEGPAAQYRMGQQAEREGRWGEALSHYSAASGHPDADAGVTRVTRTINSLQEHIVSARWYAQEGQWAAALLSVQSARDIDPMYDNLASIEAEARAHVYSQALLGTVVLREDAGPPALYYRTATEWVRLPDSDGLSKVLASNGNTRFVYDVPVKWSTPDSVSPAQSPGNPLRDRRLVAALFDEAAPRFYPLSLDTGTYHAYKIGQSGVWGLPGSRSVRGDQAEMFSGEWPLGEPVGYQAFGSTTVISMSLPGPDWVALQVEAGAGRLLLADLTGGRHRLSVSIADGSSPRPVYSLVGALGDVLISPDGHYAVLTKHIPLTEHIRKQTAVLLDLQGVVPARVLVEAETTALSGNSSGYVLPWVTVGFLSEGTLSGKVLVSRWRADATTLSIFDPARPQEPPITSNISGAPVLVMRLNEVASGGDDPWPLLTWEKDPRGISPPTGEVVAARFAPGQVAVTRTLTLQAESDVMPAGVRGDYMIWAARKRAANVDGTKSVVEPVTFYSLPLSSLDELRPQPTAFFSRPVPDPAQGRSVLGVDSSVSLGPEMLAYIQGPDLRARTYDGAVDVLLERGVVRFEGNTWPDTWPAQ